MKEAKDQADQKEAELATLRLENMELKAKIQAQDATEKAIEEGESFVEVAEESKGKRGDTELLPVIHRQNLIMLFGCPPNAGVIAATKMMLDMRNCLWHKYNRKTLMCIIPEIFDDIKGKDANIEIVQSGTAQPLEILFRLNVTDLAHAVVFVTTRLEGHKQYDNATFKGEKARTLYADTLKFDKVEVCTNFTKDQIIAKLA